MTEHIVFIEANHGGGEKTCQYARKTGRHVTFVCKVPARYRDHVTAYVDRMICVDTNDVGAIIKELDMVNAELAIDAVTTTSDFHVVQTARVAEHFGVPGTPSGKVAQVRNKHLMRMALEASCPDLNPAFARAMDRADAERFAVRNGFPLIAKPLDANDSLHVRSIRSLDGLRHYFDEREHWSLNDAGQPFADGVLLESFVAGTEYSVDVLKPLLQPFTCIAMFSKKVAGAEAGDFIKIGSALPASAAEVHLLFDQIRPGLEALGLAVGAINVDCKILDGKVKILEVNPRLSGDHVGSHMIELATGQNPAHAVVEMALGHSVYWQHDVRRAVAIHKITMPRAGYFGGIRNTDLIAADPNVAFINELGIRGQWYDLPRSNQDVVGSVIAVGPTPEDAMKTAELWARAADVVSSGTPPRDLQDRQGLFVPTVKGLALMEWERC